MKNNTISNKHPLIRLAALFLVLIAFTNQAWCQAEVEPWGNITGIRKDGQLFKFESILKIKQGEHYFSTGKELQRPHFKRIGDEQIVGTNIDSLFFTETVKDSGSGDIKVTLNLKAHADVNLDKVYFFINLPHTDYPDGDVQLYDVQRPGAKHGAIGVNYDGNVKGVEFNAPASNLKIKFDEPADIMLRTDAAKGKKDFQLYVTLKSGGFAKGDSLQQTFTIKVSGRIDRSTVDLALNTAQQGRAFNGLGGNFRLQNPKLDPQVIDYCLTNLRVAYSRVELPWRFWQPNELVDPTLTADSGKMHPAVKKAMEMAHRLDSLGVPVVLSAWFPPNWAAEGKLNFRPVNGVWGNPLNPDKMDAIYKSIADYIIYLKNKYGVEAKLFSFNESDLGINVRITPQQHDDFIKGCGAYFASHGLKTKMLLGDNSDATTYKFIYPALNDPAAKPYIGAISFHSWRGCEPDILQHWADAATKLKVPLIVGEGSIDAAAYSYPQIFQEQTYALKEISLYTRLLAICQPVSILQWQLTADYSPLIGGGIFGNNDVLHPGQRFWNLKQLSITPKGLYAMPITCDSPDVAVAALGDNSKSVYSIQLVNNGVKRKVVLTGLPEGVKQLQMYTTNTELSMKQGDMVTVKHGTAKFKMEAVSYISLISE